MESKGLEALKRNRNFVERYFVKQVEETGVYHKDMKDAMFNDLSIIEQELKALEIIKNKVWPMIGFEILTDGKSKSYRVICDIYRMDKILTQQEYDLLKEVLCQTKE